MGKNEKAALVPSAEHGLRPHFADRVYPHRGGASSQFRNGDSFSVSNESEFACDWVVKFRPSSDALAYVGDGVQVFGFSGTVIANYDGEQSLEYQPAVNPNAQPWPLPLVGKCFQVHGRTVNFSLRRIAPGADPLKPLGVEWAVIPGRVATWFSSSSKLAVLGFEAIFPIPVFATRFQLLVSTVPGDSFTQVAADGLTGLGAVSAGNNCNFLQPIDENAAFIRYNTLDPIPKRVVCGFEIIS